MTPFPVIARLKPVHVTADEKHSSNVTGTYLDPWWFGCFFTAPHAWAMMAETSRLNVWTVSRCPLPNNLHLAQV